jgi:hypothetical protein
MTRRSSPAAEPEEILADLLGLDTGLGREVYYGERAIFYNPGHVAPLGRILGSIKDRDGPNDKAAQLSRVDVYRFAFCLPSERFAELFGTTPRRPPKGGVGDLAGYDATRIGRLTPHPVYAWMRWVQVLSPTREKYELVKPLLMESLDAVKANWQQGKAS